MLPHLVSGALADRLAVMPVVVVTGARRTGKTTLAEQLVQGERIHRTLDDFDVLDAASFAELQGQLAAIQAPPLSAADQRLALPALKADMLSQIKAQQTSLRKQSGPRVPTDLLIKDSLRVLLLAYAFAMGRRITPPPLPDLL
jgi:hypothetical protein